MDIDDRVDWDVDKSVGTEFVRGDNGRIYSAVSDKVGIDDSEVFELEVVYEFGSGNDIIFDKDVKGIKFRVNVGVGGSVYQGVDRWVGYGVGSADGITFEIDDGADMVSYHGLFDSYNYWKPLCSLIYESLE